MQGTYAFVTHFEKNLGKANFIEFVKDIALDLWVCNHYRVLPTDERYKKLHEEQKYLLFVGFLEQPLPEEIHSAYRQKNPSTHIKESELLSLEKCGYGSEAIEELRKQFKLAGLM